MLIGYGQPAVITPSVAGATAVNLQALCDGRPARVARIEGGSGTAAVRADWASPSRVRIVALLGLSCPAGTLVSVTGRAESDQEYSRALGGNAIAQPVMQLPDGSRAAWFVLDAEAPALVGLQATVAASAFDVGELVILQGVELPHKTEWSTELRDPSIRDRTLGGGLNTVDRRVYRLLRMAFTPLGLAQMRGAGLANGMDLDALAYAVVGSKRVAALPRWGLAGGGIDVTELHRTALYGTAIPGQADHLGGNYYGSGWTFEEIPPI